MAARGAQRCCQPCLRHEVLRGVLLHLAVEAPRRRVRVRRQAEGQRHVAEDDGARIGRQKQQDQAAKIENRQNGLAVAARAGTDSGDGRPVRRQKRGHVKQCGHAP
jgi:hypothetical protein